MAISRSSSVVKYPYWYLQYSVDRTSAAPGTPEPIWRVGADCRAGLVASSILHRATSSDCCGWNGCCDCDGRHSAEVPGAPTGSRKRAALVVSLGTGRPYRLGAQPAQGWSTGSPAGAIGPKASARDDASCHS